MCLLQFFKNDSDNVPGQCRLNPTELNTFEKIEQSCHCFNSFTSFHSVSTCVRKFATMHSKMRGLEKETTFVRDVLYIAVCDVITANTNDQTNNFTNVSHSKAS